MSDLIIVIGRLLLTILMFFVAIVVGAVIGAVAGWCVGLLFGQTILAILAAVGIKGFTMWQIGAFLGFIASFFRPLVKFKYDKQVTQKARF